MIDPRFLNLDESDMYLYIHRYWHELQQSMKQQEPHVGLSTSSLNPWL